MALKVLIAVTHLLGVGHLARAAAIGRALGRAGHDVTLVSGGRAAPLVPLDGIAFVQLPPVHIAGTAFSRILDEHGNAVPAGVLMARRKMLTDCLTQLRPDVAITELFPFGRRALAREFMALVEAAHSLPKPPLMLASVRDILVAPSRPLRIEEAHLRLTRLYDGVLVHGDPAVMPLERSWPIDDRVAPLLHYTGYLDEDAPAATRDGDRDTTGAGEILVSAGASDAGRTLYAAAIGAAALLPGTRWRILVGGLAPRDIEELKGSAGTNVLVERTRPDFPALLGRCAVSISQGGYNTMLDLLRARARAIVVPFVEGGETEQAARAARFSELGLVHVVAARALTAERLAGAVTIAGARPRPGEPPIRREGLAETVRIVEQLATAPRRTRAAMPSSRWRDLDALLQELDDEGRNIGFWWRDDDAVMPTPALERLITLARRFEVPIAIASVPERAGGALAARLAAEPLASVLVHGLAHKNHAPPLDRKAEFGDHRPTEQLVSDAACGLARARAHFGPLPAPVFVPPWNRLSGALVPRLAALGYCGLSTFGDRAGREPAPGLVQVNCHVDPIDWRGGGATVDESDIFATVARAIERRRNSPVDACEPIGLLTHHLMHREDAWTFCERLIETFARHRAVRPLCAQTLFGQASAGRQP